MKIVVTGANGAVGQAILRSPYQQEHPTDTIVAAVRSSRAADQLRSDMGSGIDVVQIAFEDPASLDAALQGASAVVHLAGILIEGPGTTYEVANVISTRGVVESAKRCGVQKIVFVSATGADERSKNRYYRTKGEAESLVCKSGLDYTILRAPLLLGTGTAGGDSLKRHLNHSKAKLIGGGRNLQQPLCVDDLARGALAATSTQVAKNLVLDFIGPAAVPDRELVERAARLAGREVQIGTIPKIMLSSWLAVRDRFGKPGFSRDVLNVITADTDLDPEPAASALGIKLTSIDAMIQDSLAETK